MKAVTLHGENLTLHPLRAEDEALYVRLYTDPSLMTHIGPALSSARATKAFTASVQQNALANSGRWVWTVEENRAALGLIGLHRHDGGEFAGGYEVGAILQASAHNRSVAERGIRCLIAFARQYPEVDLLFTRHIHGHGAAERLMQKLGFRRTSGVLAGHDALIWQLRQVC